MNCVLCPILDVDAIIIYRNRQSLQKVWGLGGPDDASGPVFRRFRFEVGIRQVEHSRSGLLENAGEGVQNLGKILRGGSQRYKVWRAERSTPRTTQHNTVINGFPPERNLGIPRATEVTVVIVSSGCVHLKTVNTRHGKLFAQK